MGAQNTPAWEAIEEYGKPISKAEGDALFGQSVRIREMFQTKLANAINASGTGSPADRRNAVGYFTEGGIGHVFSYEVIEKLYEKMAGRTDTYLLLLDGAREKEENGIPVHNGRPTLIAMIYYLDPTDGYLHLDDNGIITLPAWPGVQGIGTEHPGTPPTTVTGNRYEVPWVVEKVIKKKGMQQKSNGSIPATNP